MSPPSKVKAPAPVAVIPERIIKKKVRQAEHVAADGSSNVTLGVPCTHFGRDVALAVCKACARNKTMPGDPRAEGAEVVCRVDPGTPPGPRIRDLDMVEAALRTPVGEVLTTRSVFLDADVSIADATKLARERSLPAIAIVDHAEKPASVVTWTELVTYAGDGARPVGEIGRPFTSAYATDGPLLHALPSVSDDAVGYAIVVAKDGTFYGLLTASDVTRWLARRAGYEL